MNLNVERKPWLGLLKEDNFKIALMYSTHNEGKSVVAEGFTKTLKVKIYKKVTATDSKSSLGYLNKLADEYKNIYHCSTSKTVVE